jgi:hypothetical protein
VDKLAMGNVYLEEVLQKETEALPPPLEIRVTGFGMWKRVIVPPNVYVVHTRQGHKEPLHIGLGLSFRYNPYRDAYLVIPATMQTIMINARSICKERQGILIQAYVQWIVEDIEIAYRKLDFSNPYDPTATVREQLREQAEATIKDKVSTMSIDEVLSDKRSIMEELTIRLREVASAGEGGLGLGIVNVQIKEAVISSARLWENLQKPFRAEKEQMARLAEIERERVIAQKEQQNEQERTKHRLSAEEEIAKLRATKEADAFDRELVEEERREEARHENEKRRIVREQALAQERADRELADQLAAFKRVITLHQEKQAAVEAEGRFDQARFAQEREAAKHQQALEDIEAVAENKRQEAALITLRQRREIENLINDQRIHERLIEILPSLAESLPTPQHLEQIQISSRDGGDTFAPILALLRSLKALLPKEPLDG